LSGAGALLGLGQKDVLTGGLAADLFILRNASGRFYDDASSSTSGTVDFAYMLIEAPRDFARQRGAVFLT
jgi:hypothetical protein